MDGTYFSRSGRRFIVMGTNWVPAHAAMLWPAQWNPAEIEKDFAQMHDMGVNTVRLDLVWAWFEPRPDDFNPVAFKQLDYLVSLAHRYQIYLHPMLLTGGEVGEAFWDVSWRHGRDPMSDPGMLRLETDLVAELARRYRNDTAILAWDLADEPPFWIVPDTTDAAAINWTRLIAGALRRYDGHHPLVVGTSMQDVSHGPFRPDDLRDEVDFFSVHPYTIYDAKLFPDSLLSERGLYGAAFETQLSGSAGRPVMIQELGASSAQYTPENVAAFDRVSMFSGLGAGANGFLLWCFTDAAPEQYSKVPYLRAPNETQFGMTTWDRKERPQAGQFRAFNQIVEQMDLAGIEPAVAEVGIIVPDEWAKPHGDFSHLGLTGPDEIPYTSTLDGGAVSGQPLPNLDDDNLWITGAWLSSYILTRQAGLKADFPREYADWSKHKMILLPSPLTSTESNLVHVHSDFWTRARKYVEQGGALYASVSGDAAIPNMVEIFGARLADRVPVNEVTLKIVAPFGDLKPGDTFHYLPDSKGPRHWGAILEVQDGTVIAVDQDGRPALVANALGSGKTLLCAYPIESYLAVTPGVFDGSENTHRIYEA
ncbi:MAG: beta-galactosidase, partial [Blastocatellia bacterium]